MRTVTEGLYLYADGHEICRKDTPEGRILYRDRTLKMLSRQGGRCCLCDHPLRKDDALFEHQLGRGHGGGKRDDRITLPSGKWLNGAVCWQCNAEKASKNIDYNQGIQK